jgi:serine/threonine-protein kinase HipA
MTSDAAQRECFVYITLPGQVVPITAGKYVLTRTAAGDALGQFIYGRSYLANPQRVEIDPADLVLAQTMFQTVQLQGVFGALRDAGPDRWGRRVIDKHSGVAHLDEMGYLLESPDDRAGALGFGRHVSPPAPLRTFNSTFELEQLQKIADALVRQDAASSPEAIQPQDLLLIGTSMGGARPKSVIADGDHLWIAKFNHPDDRWNQPRVEHAMLQLARACGITTADSRLVRVAGRDVLLVKRFDRDWSERGFTRARMISALTLLRADVSMSQPTRWSYLLLVEELRKYVSRPAQDAGELFRRMCFNALISNGDDHPRNHALIAKETSWKLSPAYDLTPSVPISEDHRDLAMDCGTLGRVASRTNLLSQHARFLLSQAEAEDILSRMQEQVGATWYATLRSCSVTESDAALIRGAFVYPGFAR